MLLWVLRNFRDFLKCLDFLVPHIHRLSRYRMPPPPPPEVIHFYHHIHAHGLVAVADYFHPGSDYAHSSYSSSMPSLVSLASSASPTDSGHAGR